MIPGFENFTNSGSMPISGDATSGNGDSIFDGRASFGGIHYNRGVNPWLVFAGLGLMAAGLYYAKA